MTYTPHGHHIDGTVKDGRPSRIDRCGGPNSCGNCRIFVASYWSKRSNEQSKFIGMLPHEDNHEKAKRLVRDFIDNSVYETRPAKETGYEIYIVWYAKTLQNWKALLFTSLPDGMYYEVTYNGDSHETYICGYVKSHQATVPD